MKLNIKETTMATVKYSDGSTKNFVRISKSNEAQLAIASYMDNIEEVKAILAEEENIDFDAYVCHSPTKGNGTPLILTASKEIAQLLIEKGAKINYILTHNQKEFTALDSALKEKNHQISQNNNIEKLTMVTEYVEYLKSNGAKTFNEIERNI